MSRVVEISADGWVDGGLSARDCLLAGHAALVERDDGSFDLVAPGVVDAALADAVAATLVARSAGTVRFTRSGCPTMDVGRDSAVDLMRWMFHGTSSEGLDALASEGLRTDTGRSEGWGRAGLDDEGEIAAWSKGKVFLTASIEAALRYAEDRCDVDGGEPTVLRVPVAALQGLEKDGFGEGSDCFVEHDVAPGAVEVLVGGDWAPLGEMAAVPKA